MQVRPRGPVATPHVAAGATASVDALDSQCVTAWRRAGQRRRWSASRSAASVRGTLPAWRSVLAPRPGHVHVCPRLHAVTAVPTPAAAVTGARAVVVGCAPTTGACAAAGAVGSVAACAHDAASIAALAQPPAHVWLRKAGRMSNDIVIHREARIKRLRNRGRATANALWHDGDAVHSINITIITINTGLTP